jgi:M6 family metalloprotease-like protein
MSIEEALVQASPKLTLAVGACLFVSAAAPFHLVAQDVEMRGRVNGVRPPPGYFEVLARDPNAYQFEEVWKELARQVIERRRALAQANDLAALNAHFHTGVASAAAARTAGVAVAGTIRIPVLVGVFSDSTQHFLPDTADLRSTLWGTGTTPPYTVTTFYDEMSNGLLQITGDIIGWFPVDSPSTRYEGSNNGLDPSTDYTGDFIQELLNAADPLVDFSIYDGDSNGRVDLIAVLHPLKDGACRTTHLWAHRWTYSGWKGSPYTTGDGVTVNDYLLQSGVGGASGCDSTQIMAIGTFSHELGHGVGLPDLYDISGNTNGIGHWGLMGSGNWNVQTSPAHMEAWSKETLGWIAVDTVSASAGSGRHALNPIVSSNTALRVSVVGRYEYFLLENRRLLGSESALHGEGLLIWHVDPDLIFARWASNTVNAVEPHGLDLEQADGLDNLRNKVNRGDAGDPFPGSTNNTTFDLSSTPNSELNDNSSSGVRIDSITINADNSVAVRVQFNVVSEEITTSVGAGTTVIVDGSGQDAPYTTSWIFPSTHTISVDSVQADGLTRYVYQSWSDGGARTHTVTADAVPDVFTANMETQHRLQATAVGNGTVTSPDVTLDAGGIAWLPPADVATLVASPTAEYAFARWTGDTTSTEGTLVLSMTRPFTVQAEFTLPVAVQTQTLDNAVMGANYADTLSAAGGLGSYTWSLIGGTLPTGMSLDEATGVISGIPRVDGSFDISVEAVSAALSDQEDLTLTVTRPTLALVDVVDHLLGVSRTLTNDEERFLDIIGNANSRFDVGDFRAYLQESGLAADVVPADLLKAGDQARASKEGGR